MIKHKNIWLPTSVEDIKSSFSFECKDVLKKNLAYNIQYLQFLARSIEKDESTNVLYRMRYKTFVITSMSIIEAIFIALLDERDLIPLDEWKEGTHHHKTIDENTIEVSFKRKRIEPKKKRINFDEAISLTLKNNILETTDKTFPIIRELQKLRNHLHLDKAENAAASDYNNFVEEIYDECRNVFYYIMTDKVISKNCEYLDFIKPKRKKKKVVE